jgi:hypothetical protein
MRIPKVGTARPQRVPGNIFRNKDLLLIPNDDLLTMIRRMRCGRQRLGSQ